MKMFDGIKGYVAIADSCRWMASAVGSNNELIVDLHPLQTIEELHLKFNRLRLLSQFEFIIAQKMSDDFLLSGVLTKKGLKIKEIIRCRINT